ncbi:Macrophage mannose receptor 1 [Araneus ventricosus]|uniref:Macrophage mannose receptor 1 n=1 Tax=Araneus ventricosus TaxID=182803 RepID=A0A4Y2HG75_ARAVE|nr:Macrophage mannose receptor 1 [Araneus ventricosus]
MEMAFKSARPQGKPGQWNDINCNQEIQFICQKAKGRSDTGRKVLDPRYCKSEQGTGWRFEKSCFHVVTESKTWSEAEEFCAKNFKGHLATIDYRVNLFLKYVLRNVTEQIWVGVKIKEEPQQKWSSGWMVSFENWVKQEEYVEGTCLLLDVDGSWLIQSCKKKLWFLCEYSTVSPPVLKLPVEGAHCPEQPPGWRDLGGELCYFFDIHAHIPWYEANFNCMRRGGTLASIHSQEEVDVLFQFVRYNPGYQTYIGFYRHLKYDEEFAWADGSKVDFTNWASGEPNLQKEQCTEMRADNMKWNDKLCSDKRGYICSTPKVTSNITTTDIATQSSCKSK